MSAEEEGPWYSDGLRFECAQCGSCCGGFPGFVWVSDDEADVLARLLGVSREEFLDNYCRRAGGRRTLREVGDYDCIMLKDGTCSVYDARPAQCRTFPFWDEKLDSPRTWESAARSCPGMNRGRLFALEEIERLRAMRSG